MEKIMVFIKTYPIPAGLIGLGVAGLVGWLIFLLVRGQRRGQFLSRLKDVIADPSLSDQLINRLYTPSYLNRNSGLIETLARKEAPGLPGQIGVIPLWVEELERKPGRKNLLRALTFGGDLGLYAAFKACLGKKELMPYLFSWLEESSDLLALRRIGMAVKGAEFDGYAALELFEGRLDEMREMAGDPEWGPRYFAVKILLHHKVERSLRAVWEAFRDPHPYIRGIVAWEFKDTNRGKLFENLFTLLIDDPVYEVRQKAARRIRDQFSDLYDPHPDDLTEDQIYHILEQAEVGVKKEEDLALRYLDGDNMELRLIAVEFLEKCGALSRLCRTADLGDREGLDRSLRLLVKAAEVNNLSCFEDMIRWDNPASFYIAAEILKVLNPPRQLHDLAREVFRHYTGQREWKEVYERTLEAIKEWGSEPTLELLLGELEKWKKDEPHINLLLEKIPRRGGCLLSPALLTFLEDEDFVPEEPLLRTLSSFSSYHLLPALFRILRSPRESFAHKVKIRAFKLLGRLGLPYCLQFIFEYLPVLPVEEAREFAGEIVKTYPREQIQEKVDKLFQHPDSRIRASIITTLPATGEYMKYVKESLKDADPDVRIAAVWATAEYRDAKSLASALPMLRDPLSRVRMEAARAIGSHGGKSALDQLKELLWEANEVFEVKRAALEGLKISSSPYAMEILLEYGLKEDSVEDEVVTVLSSRHIQGEVTRMVEEFRNADPSLRALITRVFKEMGVQGEESLVALLKEDIQSLKPYLAEILESTGGVESIVRRMERHRDVAVRREGAEILTLIGTASAFRGLVLAARDPDEEVRVKVVKALEKLETREGKEILKQLMEDPDEKVRKYTHWALERLKAKEL